MIVEMGIDEFQLIKSFHKLNHRYICTDLVTFLVLNLVSPPDILLRNVVKIFLCILNKGRDVDLGFRSAQMVHLTRDFSIVIRLKTI